MRVFTFTHLKDHLNEVFDIVRSGEEVVVSESEGKRKLAVIRPYNKYRLPQRRVLGILKGKATFKITDGFKLRDQDFLNS